MRGALCLLTFTRTKAMDHPRVCGEHIMGIRELPIESGSSPRMRGAPDHVHRRLQRRGIIPAYAGSTLPVPNSSTTQWDHPRVCGEHFLFATSFASAEGSSPRMRGALASVLHVPLLRGIIPAYAGSTSDTRSSRLADWDHPRVCGEHIVYSLLMLRYTGSSPRMRGALSFGYRGLLLAGIIPAYAGSTFYLAHGIPFFLGSSPRMRGARRKGVWYPCLHGIIPAYAGSTLHEVHRSDSKAQFLYGCQGSANQ